MHAPNSVIAKQFRAAARLPNDSVYIAAFANRPWQRTRQIPADGMSTFFERGWTKMAYAPCRGALRYSVQAGVDEPLRALPCRDRYPVAPRSHEKDRQIAADPIRREDKRCLAIWWTRASTDPKDHVPASGVQACPPTAGVAWPLSALAHTSSRPMNNHWTGRWRGHARR